MSRHQPRQRRRRQQPGRPRVEGNERSDVAVAVAVAGDDELAAAQNVADEVMVCDG